MFESLIFLCPLKNVEDLYDFKINIIQNKTTKKQSVSNKNKHNYSK